MLGGPWDAKNIEETLNLTFSAGYWFPFQGEQRRVLIFTQKSSMIMTRAKIVHDYDKSLFEIPRPKLHIQG